MTIFDPSDARARRDAALVQVSANASPAWKAQAEWAVKRLAMTRHEFTTDDVWHELVSARVSAPREPRALGAVMKAAAAAGWIAPTNRIAQSARPECHARPVRVWESLLIQTLF